MEDVQDVPQEVVYDPRWEYKAPHFYDFENMNEDEDADDSFFDHNDDQGPFIPLQPNSPALQPPSKSPFKEKLERAEDFVKRKKSDGKSPGKGTPMSSAKKSQQQQRDLFSPISQQLNFGAASSVKAPRSAQKSPTPARPKSLESSFAPSNVHAPNLNLVSPFITREETEAPETAAATTTTTSSTSSTSTTTTTVVDIPQPSLENTCTEQTATLTQPISPQHDQSSSKKRTRDDFEQGDDAFLISSLASPTTELSRAPISNDAASVVPSAAPTAAALRLTVPVSPKLKTPARQRAQPVKSTEQMQIEEAKKQIEENKQMREQAAKRMKSAPIVTAAPTIVRSSKPLTVPSAPKFVLDDVLAKHKSTKAAPTPAGPSSSFSSFSLFSPSATPAPMNLTATAKKSAAQKLQLTVAKSPRFQSAIRAQFKKKRMDMERAKKAREEGLPDDAEPEPYVPLGEKIQEFGKKLHDTSDVANKELASHLTHPVTPKLISTMRSRPVTAKSAAEIEAEEMAKMPQFKARELDKRVFESRGDLGVPRVMKPPLTETQPFSFATSLRAHEREREKPIAVANTMDDGPGDLNEVFAFKATPMPSLRTSTKTTAKKPRLVPSSKIKLGPTRPEPFNLRVDERAEQHKMTHPNEPTIDSAGGQQPFVPMAKLVQDFQNRTPKRFRTKPANEPPTLPPPSLPPPLTHPHTPELTTALRAALKPQHLPEPSQPPAFQALPLNSKIFEKPGMGVPNVPKKPPTNPKTPKLNTKQRAVLHDQKKGPEDGKEESREFKALPLYEHVLTYKPPPAPQPKFTQPDPFKLTSLERHEEYKHKFEGQVHEQLVKEKEQAEFRAQPLVDAKPFIPHKSSQPLTQPSDFELSSDRRALERREFDLKVQEKLHQIEEMKKKMEDERKEREAAEVAELRRKAVHKALPMPIYKAPKIVLSDKPLTEPKTPQLATKKRARLHSQLTTDSNR